MLSGALGVSELMMMIHWVISVNNVFHLLQVDLKLTGDVSPHIIGSVRGSEWDAPRVKEATLLILQAYCDSLAVSFHGFVILMTVHVNTFLTCNFGGFTAFRIMLSFFRIRIRIFRRRGDPADRGFGAT